MEKKIMKNKRKNFKFYSDVDELEIDCMAIYPEGEIKGVLQIVHGMCEHKERYCDFMDYIAGKGYLCVIHDNRGHGKSVKTRADFGYFYEGGYEALIEDVYKMTKIVKEHIKDVPYYLLGHSMGAMAVRGFMKAYDNEVDKVILLANASKIPGMRFALNAIKRLEMKKGGHAHSKFIDKYVIDFVFERKFKSEKTKNAWLSSDKTVVDTFNNDKYCNFTFTLDGYVNLLELMSYVYDEAGYGVKNPELPIMIMSGRNDPCIIKPREFGKSVRFIKELGYTKVSARLYGNMRHEILNEKRKKRVYRDIYEFLS